MTVSVCIATYNGALFIEEQLSSILSQLRENDEVIISDDHSTDETLFIVDGFKDSRIKVVINESGKGYTSNFENALKHSTADVIFLSDQDDIWLPEKVETCIKYLLSGYDFVVTDAEIIDANNTIISSSFFKISKPSETFVGNLIRFGYLGCCMCFKRTILLKAIPFPRQRLLCTHDNWLFVIAVSFFRVKYLKRPLIQYRRHSLNTSSGRLKKTKTILFFKIKYRLYLIYHLIKRV